MKRIRIGKDIRIRWEITTDGAAVPLEGRDLLVEIKTPFRVVSNIPFSVDGNTLILTYYGTEQKWVGEYSITLWENKGKKGQNVVDTVNAFELVKTSPEEDDFVNGDIQVESIDLGTANLAILSGGAPVTPGESPDLSALQSKVAANTASISKINEELDNKDREISQINTKLNNHEERLVYTESDLVKVREEYDGIISELVKSIGRTQKAFVVETNDSEGYIMVDNVKKTIPANSIKAFRFNNTFLSPNNNPGIKSFRFLITDTSEITNMVGMFLNCSSLTSLDLSNFDTSAVKNMTNMFFGCSSLISLDLSRFDTYAVTSMPNMFFNCSQLISLDLSSLDTSAVTNMASMFFGCSSLISLDLSNFETSAVTNMFNMFYNCSSLTSLDLSNFDTRYTTNMGQMFYICSSLTSLILGPNFFKTSAVTDIDFSWCGKWTNETVVTSLVTNSYDRAAAGLNTLTLILHNNTKAALTDEQKATITTKGYTIA